MKIGAMIRWKYILIPFVTENSLTVFVNGYTGHTFVYIFGIRVAAIQRTEPWKEKA